jgi:hypothetical protein
MVGAPPLSTPDSLILALKRSPNERPQDVYTIFRARGPSGLASFSARPQFVTLEDARRLHLETVEG